MIPPHDALLAAYTEHATEYRMQVQLGWDRLRFFLTLNVALLAALSGFKGHGMATVAGYLAGALASLLGAHTVRKTHAYYRAARDAFKAVEQELGLTPFAMTTTKGVHGLRISTAGTIVLILFAELDLTLAVLALL